MAESWQDASVRGVAMIENELVVRDFLEVWGARDSRQLIPFLHPEVVYSASSSQEIAGRARVLEMCDEVHRAFTEIRIALVTIAVAGSVVLTEHALHLRSDTGEGHWLRCFGSYELRGEQIVTWRQLHG
ncbi:MULTISPECIES: nuclear transport factor 2 family protein [unclassified Rathayibacter]|uniref:nuclear transport factor 2 family protein n=1 Tax=unclassified Rathayibacter TaxID=2609250 RepID=UPI000CE7DBC9|nr:MULTISPECIES: nuclear transport factor 2 family protein [unclassified Rathayibacter]PPF16812.1 hypothetical protein C5B92_10670 [Rathayibacter sp. AY1A4]PPG80934.1 hypothetical protein C5C52_10035 [Rathayibacter sp. AY1E5]PPH30708.1 hypothetical protein C5C94_09820 [Rathayibacter sp. AY1C3]PPH59822.1 hypothetical protein C5D25_12025 [Rathayibacter sp. AY1D7]PPI28969.1 hypothetical protein C5D66_12790 [Rathayibacter sp. AY1B4]